MFKKKLIINAIFILIIILYIPIIFQSFKEPLHSYAFTELHINYLGGFIRRGLLGEISRLFSPLINNIYFFASIFGILYFIHIILFYKLIKKFENFSLIIIFLCLSPSLLVFPITHPENYMRNDIFFIIAILSHSLFIYRSSINNVSLKNYSRFQKIYLIPFLFLNILIHEAQIFFISVHLLLSYTFVQKNLKEFFKSNFAKIYLVLLIPFIVVILNPGNHAEIEEIKYYLSTLLHVNNLDPINNLYGNINLALGLVLKSFYFYTYETFLNLFAAIILSIISFILLFHYLIDKKIVIIKNSLIKNYFIFFIPCLFIFVAGADFGRWMNILSFHLLAFYFILNIDENKKIAFNLRTWILVYICLFSYVFLWTLPEGFMWGQKVFHSSMFHSLYNLTLNTYHFINLNIIELPLNNFMK